MIYSKTFENSSNIARVDYDNSTQELKVFFLPKKRKNSFETLEALQEAYHEVAKVKSGNNVWADFQDKYETNYFDEYNRLTRKTTLAYIYKKVPREVYDKLMEAESIGKAIYAEVAGNKENPYEYEVVEEDKLG